MAGAGRSLVSRRRRADEEGEDDESVTMVEDSQSEGSILSEDTDADDASELSDRENTELAAPGPTPADSEMAAVNGTSTAKKTRKAKSKKKATRAVKESPASETTMESRPHFKAVADTEATMNGIEISSDASQEPVDFESMAEHGGSSQKAEVVLGAAADNSPATPAERQRREHEDYRKKRDADPTFIPNRGNFFMHDSRAAPNARGFGPRGRGGYGAQRGRGGATMGGPFSPAQCVEITQSHQTVVNADLVDRQMQQAQQTAEQQPWKHDLHETVNEDPAASAQAVDTPHADSLESARLFPKANAPTQRSGPTSALSFSKSTLLGKIQLRVFLPGMKAPIQFTGVPVKAHTRLPDHRPPLRRDKPVRISLPDHPPRYIFPATDRSFIFIPRQMRPNQQGYGRNSFNNRNYGGYGYSSRRTSMYGGSVYSASVAASRRSSFARDTSRENAFSPAGSFAGMPPPARPVVRLPQGAQYSSATGTPTGQMSGFATPTHGPQVHTYPLPQQPTFHGTAPSMVHQPRPQKAISVTGIESPAALIEAPQPTPQDQQPFHNQLPDHLTQQLAYNGQQAPPYYSPHQQAPYPYPPQPQAGTPLSSIPERAIHAQPFQPPGPYGQVPYYPPYAQPQAPGYYYPPPAPNGYAPLPPMPVFVPPPQPAYMMPPQPPPVQEQQHSEDGSTPQQSGMVARESNGMVFYMPASEAQQQDQPQFPAESFVPTAASYPVAMPPTPGPEAGYYYTPPQGMYYPSQQ